MTAKAILRNARVSPQKARLVANLVRGMDLDQALEALTFTRKKSAGMIKRLIESAVANAENIGEQTDDRIDVDNLYVKTIYVDGGTVLRRWRPRAMGRATRVIKRTSHITVELDER